MIKKLIAGKWYQELMKENWGITAHFFLCSIYSSFMVWLIDQGDFVSELNIALYFFSYSLILFGMIVWEKNELKTIQGVKDPVKDMWQDIIANHIGLVNGFYFMIGVLHVHS